MDEFQDMQRYIAECAGGEWTEHGSWSYDRNIVDVCHYADYTGLEDFLSMRTTDDTLTPEELREVSAILLWLVDRPPLEGGLEGVAIRTHIREFARDCREDAQS